MVMLALVGCGGGSSPPVQADVPAGDSALDAPLPVDVGVEPVDAPEVAMCPAGDGLTGSPACLACQAEHCCVVASNCADDPECVATLACTDSSCRGLHPAGVWNWSGLINCRKNDCATECGLVSTRCGGITPEPATCATCLRQECCAEGTACGANDSCLAFVYQCLDQNQCAPPDACSRACRARYPEGAAVFDVMDTCVRTRCRGC